LDKQKGTIKTSNKAKSATVVGAVLFGQANRNSKINQIKQKAQLLLMVSFLDKQIGTIK